LFFGKRRKNYPNAGRTCGQKERMPSRNPSNISRCACFWSSWAPIWFYWPTKSRFLKARRHLSNMSKLQGLRMELRKTVEKWLSKHHSPLI